jgi:hypothetical protein
MQKYIMVKATEQEKEQLKKRRSPARKEHQRVYPLADR